MKLILQTTVLVALLCITSYNGHAQTPLTLGEYGPYNISAGPFKELFNRDGIKLYARIVQGSSNTDGATVYFRIENKNSKAAFVQAGFKVTGSPRKSRYDDGASSEKGGVPGDKVNSNSYIEVARYLGKVSFVQTIAVTLNAIYLGDKAASGSGL